MVAWGIHQAAAARSTRRCAFAGALAALAILTGLAYRQTAFWRNDETLWRHTLDCTENNYVAHLHVGMAMTAQGRFAEAIEQYHTAKRLEQHQTAKRLAGDDAKIAT